MDPLGYYDEDGRPRILVILNYKGKVIKSDPIIDSGADFSLIPKKLGLSLGMKLPKRPKGYSKGVGGKVPIVHKQIEVEIGREKIKTTFAWLYTRDDVPVVLGRKNIFDYFNIEFRQTERKILFKKNK